MNPIDPSELPTEETNLSQTLKKNSSQVQIEKGWFEVLKDEFSSAYFADLKRFLQQEKRDGKVIYPPGNQIFNAFNTTPFDKVKVVILGQDPYHGSGQAHGLCFSVQHGIKPPPSLVNIYKELKTDLGIMPPAHGCLQRWAEQGVLLLNAILTVQASNPASHHGRGWERFTDAVIRHLSEDREGLVFLLWGRYAQEKGVQIDRNKHLVLTAAHPSPFSAHSGFFGCKHFSHANVYLELKGKEPVNWILS